MVGLRVSGPLLYLSQDSIHTYGQEVTGIESERNRKRERGREREDDKKSSGWRGENQTGDARQRLDGPCPRTTKETRRTDKNRTRSSMVSIGTDEPNDCGIPCSRRERREMKNRHEERDVLRLSLVVKEEESCVGYRFSRFTCC